MAPSEGPGDDGGDDPERIPHPVNQDTDRTSEGSDGEDWEEWEDVPQDVKDAWERAEARRDAQPQEASQPSEPSDRIRSGDQAKFTIRGHAVTANEVHALLLGVLVGAGLGVAGNIGYPDMVRLAAVAVGAYAVLGSPALRSMPHWDPKYEDTMVVRTIKREPWWFLATYIPTTAVVLGVVPVV